MITEYIVRVFSEYAKTGKSSMEWFYGFKLHLIINDEREILSFCHVW
ncbi:MAG: transposase [Ruminococcus sp.]|nr:transposase [Ruminococcus sp.]